MGRVRVIDGDTFDVAGVRVRVHGIDAPETDQTCETEQGTRWACGAWVTSSVAVMYDGKRAICREVDQDRYGRIVARCEIAGRDVGQQLVSRGLAFAYRKYSMAYDLDEKGAAVNDRGLHASRVQDPAQFRKTRAKGRIPIDKNCAIKGNITKSGKIFHVPGQRDYERTGINLAKDERWFCTEHEARAAGWRKARR
ncbi:thermonuclease family protein [Planktotalea sp.]|uniref:thermonuclease family protein n=1 Tax=Planktotalea sp. TaxID=2029877 RepID=UPI003D6B83FF